MWAASTLYSTIYVLNSTSMTPYAKAIGNTPINIAFDGSYVWFTRDSVVALHKESSSLLL
jgi:hypothetical protein